MRMTEVSAMASHRENGRAVLVVVVTSAILQRRLRGFAAPQMRVVEKCSLSGNYFAYVSPGYLGCTAAVIALRWVVVSYPLLRPVTVTKSTFPLTALGGVKVFFVAPEILTE